MWPSAAVDTERHQAEENGDAHQGGGGRRSEEVPVLDLAVPQHRQHEQEQGHHQAAHVERHLNLVGGRGSHRRAARCMLGDVAVEHAVVGQVEGGQRLGVILQQLTLVDEPHLVLLAREVRPGGGGGEIAVRSILGIETLFSTEGSR